MKAPGPGKSPDLTLPLSLLLVPILEVGEPCLIDAKSGLYYPGPGFSSAAFPPG